MCFQLCKKCETIWSKDKVKTIELMTFIHQQTTVSMKPLFSQANTAFLTLLKSPGLTESTIY